MDYIKMIRLQEQMLKLIIKRLIVGLGQGSKPKLIRYLKVRRKKMKKRYFEF